MSYPRNKSFCNLIYCIRYSIFVPLIFQIWKQFRNHIVWNKSSTHILWAYPSITNKYIFILLYIFHFFPKRLQSFVSHISSNQLCRRNQIKIWRFIQFFRNLKIQHFPSTKDSNYLFYSLMIQFSIKKNKYPLKHLAVQLMKEFLFQILLIQLQWSHKRIIILNI